MKRPRHSTVRIVSCMCACALLWLMCACASTVPSSQTSSSSGADSVEAASEQSEQQTVSTDSQQDASDSSQVSSTSTSSSSTSSSAGGFSLFGSGEKDRYVTVENKLDYSTGIHHAEIVFEGYESTPLKVEIYSHSASQTAKKFCTLVDKGFYNGKPVFWILNELYMRIGNTEQDNDYLITGEYEESDVTNSNSLKRGVIALNRAEDGQQSDASSFFICMSDLSYLDGKYAAFAKITENYEVIKEIANRTSTDENADVPIDSTGRVADEAKYPILKTITMID